jgi:signal transduction histidine kinase
VKGQDQALVLELSIRVKKTSWGKLILGFSLAHLNQTLGGIQAENKARLKQLSVNTLYVSIFILMLVYLIISKLADKLTDPLIKLSGVAQNLSSKNCNIEDGQLPITHDEVGMLAMNLQDMADRLKGSYLRLADYSTTLEHRVVDRTKALNEKNSELVKALKNVEEGQQQLIQSEKMAALGQLVSGIAHEVNTPLGAIQASVGNANKSLDAFLNIFSEIMDANEKERAFFLFLVKTAGPVESLTTREERRLKREVSSYLEKNDVRCGEDISEMFVEMGLHGHIQQIVPKMKEIKSAPMVKAAYVTTGINRSHQTIFTAVNRASKVVYALKSFSHHDMSGQKILHNVVDGINTVLVLYQNLLKQGIHVVKEFDVVPDIPCYPDELNQVWTNLIHNAIQAMENEGTLSIKVQNQQVDVNKYILVTVSDTGTGIPSEIKDFIFNSFFSTKPSGQGTGLGLAICKQILDKHEGKIDAFSQPGHTSFIVTLPIF